MMRFGSTLVPGIPRLAWYVRRENATGGIHLFHGAWVETREDGFVEGSWAGPYDQWDFDRAFMTGTGGRFRDGSLVFVAPNHTLDRICELNAGDVSYYSNSIPLILAASGEQLDDDFLFYDSYVASIRQGLGNYERAIPTRSKRAVSLHYCANLVLGDNGVLRSDGKSPSPAFADFGTYREHLAQTIREIASNASAGNRKIRYSPLTTISRGYDSPAVAVLAKSGGCERAVTFRQARRGSPGEDCGTELGKALGLTVDEFGRLDYRSNSSFDEIRNSGGPSEFLSFGLSLRGTLLFTGFHGGGIWDTKAGSVSSELVRSDASGSSLTEFRIETGFVHLPVPFIGADSHRSIHAISIGEEMAQWSVGGSYDRPIPRRIVEGAGVPRGSFGQRKRAAGIVVTTEGLEQTMSDASLADFRKFVGERWSARNAWVSRLLVAARRVVSWNEFLGRAAARVLRPLGVSNIRVPIVVPQRLRMLAFGYLGKESLLFHWGVAKLVDEYRAALTKCGH